MEKRKGKFGDKFENLREKMDVREINFSEHPSFHIPRTFGQKASDGLTKWAGSWTFILSVGFLLGLWIIVNTSYLIFGETWDPYPFILLNFILSTLAAIQAPIILMSQNRQGQKDRIRAQVDFDINKKAETEIRAVKKQLNKIEEMLSEKKK